jgi:hypothetical protein
MAALCCLLGISEYIISYSYKKARHAAGRCNESEERELCFRKGRRTV